ncbi:MAG: hypothetical protein R3C30_16990 [Hyphomonadaceae bacterium]
MFAAERAAPGEATALRERENCFAIWSDSQAMGRWRMMSISTLRRRSALEIRDGRIAELERALETARGRADELTSELAETQRGGRFNELDAQELARLRAAEEERSRMVDAEAEPVEDETVALQAWRLRYFEQRVNYLEGRAAAAAPEASPVPAAVEEMPPLLEWTAREATARASFLTEASCAMRAQPPRASGRRSAGGRGLCGETPATDMLLRWRLLYLERRVSAAGRCERRRHQRRLPIPIAGSARARYLEARVRHLEQRPPQTLAAEPEPGEKLRPRQFAPLRRRPPAGQSRLCFPPRARARRMI